MGKDNLVGKVLDRTVKKIKKGLAIGTLSLVTAIVAPAVLDSVVNTSYDIYRAAKTSLTQFSQSGAERGYIPNREVSLSYNRPSTIESQARGDPIDVGPGTKYTTYNDPLHPESSIQLVISNPKYDTITFKAGTCTGYTLGGGVNDPQFYNLEPNKNYIFEKLTISGSGFDQHPQIFRISNGGNINISGDLTIQNSIVGIKIKTSRYDKISIGGMSTNNVSTGVLLYDIPFDSEPEKAAVDVINCVFNNGQFGIDYYPNGITATRLSPYNSSIGNKGINLSGYLTCSPKALDIAASSNDPSAQSAGIIILNTNAIEGNITIDCNLSSPLIYGFYGGTPRNTAQTPLDPRPFMNGYYGIPPSNPPPIDNPPIMPIPIGQKDDKGNYICPWGDADMNGIVDLVDLVALARHWGKTPTIWTEGNFNEDSIVDLQDLVTLARHWGNTVQEYVPPPGQGVPEPYTLTLLALGGLALLKRKRTNDRVPTSREDIAESFRNGRAKVNGLREYLD